MAYKSKEQFPLIHNPKKKSFCHIDPRSGRVCSVHFHKGALKNAVAADPSWLQEQTWNDPFASNDEWSFEVGGYDMSTLNQDFGISFEEITKMQNYPPKRGVAATTDAANELFEAFNDRSRRQYMDKDVQVAIVSERIKATEPEFRKLREELDRERQNKEYPGNNQIGSEFPKSNLYYKLIGEQRQMFEDRARLYQQAGYALGLENSSNELVKKAMSVSPDAGTTWHRDSDGIERTYWNQPFSQLMSVVDNHARSELTVAKYNEEKKRYSGLAASKNSNIATHGTNDFENRIKPSPKLVEARVEFAIKESLFNRAQSAFDSSNIFNRRGRKKALSEAKWKLNAARTNLNGRELE
jgi:hypothetical protein